jgi:hypothetical protein
MNKRHKLHQEARQTEKILTYILNSRTVLDSSDI